MSSVVAHQAKRGIATSGGHGVKNRKLRVSGMKWREQTGVAGSFKPLKPASSDALPPTRLHILYLLQKAPSTEDHVFQRLSLWRVDIVTKPP